MPVREEGDSVRRGRKGSGVEGRRIGDWEKRGGEGAVGGKGKGGGRGEGDILGEGKGKGSLIVRVGVGVGGFRVRMCVKRVGQGHGVMGRVCLFGLFGFVCEKHSSAGGRLVFSITI